MCAKRLKEYFHAGKILAVWLVIEEDAADMLCLKESVLSLCHLSPETSPLLHGRMARVCVMCGGALLWL